MEVTSLASSVSQNIAETQKEGKGTSKEAKQVPESSVNRAQALTDTGGIQFPLKTYLFFLYVLF